MTPEETSLTLPSGSPKYSSKFSSKFGCKSDSLSVISSLWNLLANPANSAFDTLNFSFISEREERICSFSSSYSEIFHFYKITHYLIIVID